MDFCELMDAVCEAELEAAQPRLRGLQRRFPSRVYFAHANRREAPVKVGLSRNPDQRLKALRNASPERVYMIASIPGTRAVERRIHEALAPGRLEGEWFRWDTPGLQDLIEAAVHLEGFPWDWASPCVRPVLRLWAAELAVPA